MGNPILENKRTVPLYKTLSLEERYTLMRLEANRTSIFPGNYDKAQYADLFTKEEALALASTLPVKSYLYLSALSFLDPETRLDVMEKRGTYHDPSNFPCIELDNEEQKRRFLRIVKSNSDMENIVYLDEMLKNLDLKISYEEWEPLYSRAYYATKNSYHFNLVYSEYLGKLNSTQDYLKGLRWAQQILQSEGWNDDSFLHDLLTRGIGPATENDHIFAIYEFAKEVEGANVVNDLGSLFRNASITKRIYDDFVKTYGIDSLTKDDLMIIMDKLHDSKDKEVVLDQIMKKYEDDLEYSKEVSLGGAAFAEYITSFGREDQFKYFQKYLKYLDKSDVESYIREAYDHNLDDFYKTLIYCHKEKLIKDSVLEETFFTTLAGESWCSDVPVPEYIIDFFCKQGKYPEANLRKFITKYNHLGIAATLNKNISKALSMDEERFNKYMDLMDNHGERVNNGNINDVVSIVLMQKFKHDCSDVYNRFVDFENAIRRKDRKTIEKLWTSINDVENMKMLSERGYDNSDEFLDKLTNGSDGTLKILHDLTDRHIAKKRETYFKDHQDELIEKLNLSRKYDMPSFIDEVLRNYHPDVVCRTIKNGLKDPAFSPYNGEIPPIFASKERFKELINIRKGKGYPYFNEKFRTVSQAEWNQFEELIEANESAFSINMSKVRSKIVAPYYDTSLELMREINPTNIDFDSPYYKYLKERVLNKYNMLSWGDIFKEGLAVAEIDAEDHVLSAMISHFDVAFFSAAYGKVTENKDVTLKSILDSSAILSYESNKYMKLLGKETFEYIQKNPTPNSSCSTKHNRLEKAVQLVRDMYHKDEVCVPPIELTTSVGWHRKLNVTIGNSTSMGNLVSGEKTGACTRICGAFEQLFYYALAKKNGFFVMINDPVTGDLVSRVIGVRNGNSVFLNELRYTTKAEQYSNGDIAKIGMKVGKMLVEKTAKDPHPIENVFGIKEMAFEGKEANVTVEEAEDIIKGLADLPTNFLHDNTFVIATAAKDGSKYCPLKFGEEYNQSYPCCSEPPVYLDKKIGTEDSMKEQIVRKIFANEVVNSDKTVIDIDEIDIDKHPLVQELEADGISKCWVCDTYYFYIDKHGNKHKFVMDLYKDNKLVQSEVNEIEKVIDKELKKGGHYEEKRNSQRNK